MTFPTGQGLGRAVGWHTVVLLLMASLSTQSLLLYDLPLQQDTLDFFLYTGVKVLGE